VLTCMWTPLAHSMPGAGVVHHINRVALLDVDDFRSAPMSGHVKASMAALRRSSEPACSENPRKTRAQKPHKTRMRLKRKGCSKTTRFRNIFDKIGCRVSSHGRLTHDPAVSSHAAFIINAERAARPGHCQMGRRSLDSAAACAASSMPPAGGAALYRTFGRALKSSPDIGRIKRAGLDECAV
jgi:hypothetical protein